MKKKNLKSEAYKPKDAKLNLGTDPMEPPETEYEKDRATLDKDEVKKVTKGIYGTDQS